MGKGNKFDNQFDRGDVPSTGGSGKRGDTWENTAKARTMDEDGGDGRGAAKAPSCEARQRSTEGRVWQEGGPASQEGDPPRRK